MTVAPLRPVLVWTDVALQPEAAALLSDRAQIEGPVPDAGDADPLMGIEAADGAIVSTRFPGTASSFARATRLQVVARVGIGCDNIDISAATAAGICAVNTPDAPTESTAEFTVGLMFAVARRITVADRAARTADWALGPQVLGFDLAGKSLGLVGFGRIGRRVAAIVAGLPMKVWAFDPFVPTKVMVAAGVEPAATLPDLLGAVDVVSVHVPLGAETRGMIGRAELARMRPGAIILNTSRGPVIDEEALAEALRSGHLAGAGIDVWAAEPAAPDHPLLQFANVVATPHVAAYTREGRRRSHLAAAEQVLMVLTGKLPPHLLNPEVWSRRRGAAGVHNRPKP